MINFDEERFAFPCCFNWGSRERGKRRRKTGDSGACDLYINSLAWWLDLFIDIRNKGLDFFEFVADVCGECGVAGD